MKNRAKVKNHAAAKRVNPKNHTAAIDLNVLITTNGVTLAEDAERKNIIPALKEMLIVNGIKGICGSIDATAKCQVFIFETLFKREYDKKGFFYFVEK
ncbi:hypothetical protein RE735_14210 [Bacillus aerius]|uniref:hypothetical protein n=1 Tax=Bacillus aerius TaxID=293388 RepID=UPI002814EA80|nr:hypothetical protein [Bacillus aerius]WMT28269.1 hypothetical protein RE735_14210 [Bacillus aerius]